LEGSNQTKHTNLPTLQQMKDTPETDKAERMAYSQEHMVPTEFARQLERERNELQVIVQQRLLAGAIIHQKAEDLHKKCEQYEAFFVDSKKMLYSFSKKLDLALFELNEIDWRFDLETPAKINRRIKKIIKQLERKNK
jgi:hypothetical protein